MKANTTIYKYQDWNNDYNKRTLTHNEIYFAKPSQFNDPFDCRITPNYNLLSKKEEKEWVEIMIKESIKNGKGTEEEIRNHIWNKLLNNRDNLQKGFDVNRYKSQDKHYGIYCLSRVWDSILMWSHYANFHQGFVVGFNYEKLSKYDHNLNIGDIVYDLNFPEINPMEHYRSDIDMANAMIKEVFTKHKDWVYEKEIRLFKTIFPSEFSEKDRIVNYPDYFIEEMTIGCASSKKTKEELIEIGRQKGINKIYLAKKTPFKFGLDRILV